MKFSLKFLLETLNNNFVNNKVIKNKTQTATITNGRITSDGIDSMLPAGCYFLIEGSIFNHEVYKVATSGTGYVEDSTLIAETERMVTIKACLIPKAVIDFSAEEHTIPTMKSESIGNYSYSTDNPGVQAMLHAKLGAYYQAVVI